MADTVRMVNADGDTYDIPKSMEAKAFADGLRREESALTTFMNVGSDANLLARAAEKVTGTEPQLGDIARKYGQQVLIGKDGSTYVMPADEAKEAMKNGLRMPDMADDMDRTLVAKAEASIDPSNEGFRGMAKAAVNSARSQFVETATFGLLDPEKDLLSREQRAAFEQSKEMNPVSSGMGSALGFAGGIAADPFSVAGTAGKAGSAVERAVMGEATSLGGKVAGGALKGAVEGGVMSAPAATRALLEGDPEKAGETLLAGIGIGTLFGGGGRLAGMAKRAIGESGSKLATEVAEGAETRIGRIDAATNPTLTAEEVMERGSAPVTRGEKIVEAASEKLPGAILKAAGLTHGVAGYLIGERIAGAMESPGVQRLFANAMKKGAEGLLSIGPALGTAAEAAGQGAKVGSLNAMARLVGGDESDPREKQFEQARTKIIEVHTDLEHRANRIGTLATAAPKGAHAEALATAANRAVDYLYNELPKEPQRSTLFQMKRPWRPSDADFARYERKVQVVMNPFSIIDELKKGTLTREHVEALDAVYPALAFEMRNAVLKEAQSPKAPVLSKAKRAKLEFLLKMPIEDSRTAVAFYQGLYGKPANDNAKGGQQALANISGGEETRAQALASRK